MKLKKIIWLVGIILAFNAMAWADSPLTSTEFSKAYSDEEIVVKASKTNGVLTEELMNYLVNSKKPIDVKMAVINQLGWNIDGKNNTSIFLDFIARKYGDADLDQIPTKDKADVILCLSYLKAMDNYFDVKSAEEVSKIAVALNPRSRTFNLIAGLIQAQRVMEQSFCEVYQITDHIRKNTNLEDDIKPEAVSIIYDYMDAYKDECK